VVTTRVLLVVADGAAAAFAAAATPAWDDLPHAGWLDTVPDGLPVASEVALPTLLGVDLHEAPARGPVEGAGRGVAVPPRGSAWRLDLVTATARPDVLARDLSLILAADVHHLRRGRFVVVAPERWLVDGGTRAREATVLAATGVAARLWGGGRGVTLPSLPWTTAVVAAPTGAAAGVARLLGADLRCPPGATGFPDTDLVAKTAAAVDLLRADRHRVIVVHVGAPDEAGHARDAVGQVRCVEAIDREVIAPLSAAAAARGIALVVTADHATDPTTGQHAPGPVPVRATVPLPSSDARLLLVGIVGAGVAA
jgi:2,3-bisphosphoglycerate-independent phosphoglycerate mutase